MQLVSLNDYPLESILHQALVALAGENSRLSSLPAAWDISPGETSAHKRKKSILMALIRPESGRELVRGTQNFTKIDQEKQNRKNLYLQPRTTGLIMQTWTYVISMEFQSVRRRSLSWRNVLIGEERGKTAVFAGYSCSKGR